MSGDKGTIVALDPIDALGWIELDDGGRVRFGGTSLKGFGVNPGVGTRVVVWGTAPGYKGVIKATEVGPLDPPPPPAAPVHPALPEVSWAEFVRTHPRFSDVDEVCVPCAVPAPSRALTEHLLFAPWQREIAETAPTWLPLRVPHYLHQEPIEPSPADCFTHGRTAFLDEPRWPSCGICARPMEMCVQLSPAVMAEWAPGGRGLAALFCFHCGVSACDDPRVGHVRLVDPRHRVMGPPEHVTASSGWMKATQRVTPGVKTSLPPRAAYCRLRGEWEGTTASGALFTDTLKIVGPFPKGFDPAWLDDPGATYDDWLDEQPGSEPWKGAGLGGVAGWDQADATPSCAHGEMRHLLDYDGGQFLDGALHVFACREWSCDIAFVAEF
ncbi:MAG: hypothetical protein ABI193_21415 [Minicystis sp.]